GPATHPAGGLGRWAVCLSRAQLRSLGHSQVKRTGRAPKGSSRDMQIVWSPPDDYVERANVTRFMRAHGIGSYEELVKRSQDDIEWFWDAVVKDLGLEFFEPYSRVLDSSGGIPWSTWFAGGTVNLAHNCVDRWAERTPEAVALLWGGEDGGVRRVT